MTSERQAYVYIQLPGTLETAPAALLKIQKLGDGTYVGRFRYGDRYLQRPDAVAFDPFQLPLGKAIHEFTSSPTSLQRPMRSRKADASRRTCWSNSIREPTWAARGRRRR